MREAEIIMKARNIIKYYGRKQVLDIAEFNIYQGKFNLLLGPNGSGKTTLLNVLSLIDNNYQGSIFYQGKLLQPGESLAERRKFGVIWQNPYLYRGTVAHNIGLPLKLRGISRAVIREKVQALAGDLAIEDLLSKKSNEISGGELQKVSIARAIISEPELLFVDEPTNNLDEKSKVFYHTVFKKMLAAETTLLVITHELEQVGDLVDYVTVLKGGRIAAAGSRGNLQEYKDLI